MWLIKAILILMLLAPYAEVLSAEAKTTEYGVFTAVDEGKKTYVAVSLLAAGNAELGSLRLLTPEQISAPISEKDFSLPDALKKIVQDEASQALLLRMLAVAQQYTMSHAAYFPVNFLLSKADGITGQSVETCNLIKLPAHRPYAQQKLAAYRDLNGKGHICLTQFLSLATESRVAVTFELLLAMADADADFISDYVGTLLSSDLRLTRLDNEDLGDYRALSANLWLSNKNVSDTIFVATKMGRVANHLIVDGQNPSDHKKVICFAEGLALDKSTRKRFAIWLEEIGLPCAAGTEVNGKLVGLVLDRDLNKDVNARGEIEEAHVLQTDIGIIVARFDPKSLSLLKLCGKGLAYRMDLSACHIRVRNQGIQVIYEPWITAKIIEPLHKDLEKYYRERSTHARVENIAVSINTLTPGEYRLATNLLEDREYVADPLPLIGDKSWWIQPILTLNSKSSTEFYRPYICNQSGYCYNGFETGGWNGILITGPQTYQSFSRSSPQDFARYQLTDNTTCQCRNSQKTFRAKSGFTCKEYQGDAPSCH